MEVVVFGKHVDVSPALRSFTEEKVARIGKYAHDVRRIEVDFSEIPNPRVPDGRTCEILVHLNRHLVKSRAAAADHHAALDLALDKVEHQLRKLHDRRTQKPNSRRDGGRRAAARNGSGAKAGEEGDLAALLEAAGGAPSPDGARREPVIVKTKRFTVKPMDPEEAALQMDLLGHDFFLFTSSENGRAAVIYRRGDGDYGLIEAG
jgi:putative sigma-54 modulation protein